MMSAHFWSHLGAAAGGFFVGVLANLVGSWLFSAWRAGDAD